MITATQTKTNAASSLLRRRASLDDILLLRHASADLICNGLLLEAGGDWSLSTTFTFAGGLGSACTGPWSEESDKIGLVPSSMASCHNSFRVMVADALVIIRYDYDLSLFEVATSDRLSLDLVGASLPMFLLTAEILSYNTLL